MSEKKSSIKTSSAKKIQIRGVGKYLPSKILTNQDLEKMVDTSDKWITTRTGIRQRRIADQQTAASDMGYEAGKAAIVDAGITPQDIDMIIVATITPDMLFPSTACLIQDKLEIRPITSFDIGAACAGYIYAISIGKQFLENENYKNILIVGTEKLSSITDWEDRNTCVLFGDGAGACVLSSANEGTNEILSSYLKGDGSIGSLLRMPAGGSRLPASHKTVDNKLHYLKMEGKELFKIAVRRMVESITEALKMSGYEYDDIDWIIPHQANIRILKAVGKAIKILILA